MDDRDRRLTQEPQTLKMIREGLLRMTKTEFAQALGRHRSRATQWEHAERPQLMGEETRLDLARLIAARFSSQEKLRDYLEEVGWTFGPQEWAVAQVHLQRDEYLAGMPRVRPSEFVGRDRELQALRRAVLETGATSPLLLLIEGMPGVGKTTLAARLWADRDVRNRFEDGIIWIGVEAESPDDERADLEERALRALLDQVLPEAELSGRFLSTRRKVRRALEGQRRLMIFDGADQRIDLDQWMMVDPVFGKLVVTTRRRDLVSRKWKGRVWSTELEALEPAAARTLLTRGIERVDVKERDLDQILEKLGGVALALDIAHRLAQQSGFKYLFRGLDVDPIGALELYDPVRKEESMAVGPKTCTTLRCVYCDPLGA